MVRQNDKEKQKICSAERENNPMRYFSFVLIPSIDLHLASRLDGGEQLLLEFGVESYREDENEFRTKHVWRMII